MDTDAATSSAVPETNAQHFAVGGPHFPSADANVAAADVNAYDEVPYIKAAHQETHCRQLETLGVIFGLRPPSIYHCRVLELGSAAGWNLVPQAYDLPQSEFMGVDLSQKQVDEAQQFAGHLRLKNVEFRQADILDIDESWGQFDYILCHGVYSWVPPQVQQKILKVCRANLSADGLALVSYNTYPGWRFRGLIREMMTYHIRHVDAPQERLKQARAVVDFLSQNSQKDSAYGQMLREELKLIKDAPDAYLYHDHLERDNSPCYFHEFAQRAEATGLQFLGETQLAKMLTTNLTPAAHELLQNAPLIEQEQYQDFLRNQAFRQSVLCHAEQKPVRRLTPRIMQRMSINLSRTIDASALDPALDSAQQVQSGNRNIRVSAPVCKAALLHLTETWPQPIDFDKLHAAALERLSTEEVSRADPQRIGAEQLASLLLMMLGNQLITAFAHPPCFAGEISTRPEASPVARLQSLEGDTVTNRRHQSVSLDGLGRMLLRYLDGRHDRRDLAAKLKLHHRRGDIVLRKEGQEISGFEPGQATKMVDTMLDKFREVALLVG